MRNKIIFAVMVFFQLGVFLLMVVNKEIIIKKGNTHKFRVAPRDPYDYMRGNYLSINLDHRELAGDYENVENKNGYLILKKDGEWGKITEFSNGKPENMEYIKGKIRNTYNNKTYFENPFKRFYMEEGKAKETEKKIAEGDRSYIVVKIYKGRYVLESIEIEE